MKRPRVRRGRCQRCHALHAQCVENWFCPTCLGVLYAAWARGQVDAMIIRSRLTGRALDTPRT